MMNENKLKMNIQKSAIPWRCTHTHTHTHGYLLSE